MIAELPAVGVGGGILGLILGGGLLLRRWSKDRLEIAKDRAEGDLIGDLIRQRDDARAERDEVKKELETLALESEESMSKIREMTAQLQQLQVQNSLYMNLTQRLSAAIENSRDQLRVMVADEVSPSASEDTRG